MYPRQQQPQQHNKNEYSVYVRNMISTKVHLMMSEVGDSTKMNLERKIVRRTEGKCIPEGFVRPDSVKIISYSSGVIKMNVIEFQVVYECLICNPAEGQEIQCTTKTITKAGIHADVVTDGRFTPMKIFLARDHNYSNKTFGNVKENDTIQVRIIGKRFELNDPYIVAIASFVETKDRMPKRTMPQKKTQKTKITVLEDDASGEVPADISIPTLRVNDKYDPEEDDYDE